MASGELSSTWADHSGPERSKPFRSSSVAIAPSRTCKPARSSWCTGLIGARSRGLSTAVYAQSHGKLETGRLGWAWPYLLIHFVVVHGRSQRHQPGAFRLVNVLPTASSGSGSAW